MACSRIAWMTQKRYFGLGNAFCSVMAAYNPHGRVDRRKSNAQIWQNKRKVKHASHSENRIYIYLLQAWGVIDAHEGHEPMVAELLAADRQERLLVQRGNAMLYALMSAYALLAVLAGSRTGVTLVERLERVGECLQDGRIGGLGCDGLIDNRRGLCVQAHAGQRVRLQCLAARERGC